MNDKGRPWFRLYARDLLTDSKVAALSDAEFRLLVLAWCHACIGPGIPAGIPELRNLLKVTAHSDKKLERILGQFFVDSSTIPGHLVSARMESDAAKYHETCEKRAAAGRKSGEVRRTYAQQTPGEPEPEPEPEDAKDTTGGDTPPLPLADKPTQIDTPEQPTPKAALVVDIWNRITAGHPLPQAKLTPKRASVIATRLREPGWVTDFERACVYVTTSPFHTGQGERGWCASLDWMLKAGKATELAEKATQPTTALALVGRNHGTHRPSATHERVSANVAAIEAAAKRFGWAGNNYAGDSDGATLPDSRPDGRPGGLPARLRDASPSLFPGGGS